MGLDNGIVLRTRQEISGAEIPEHVRIDKWPFTDARDGEEQFPFAYEVCYWRKYWGFRGAAIGVLGGYPNGENNDGVFEVTPGACEALQDILYTYLKEPGEWEENGNDYVWSMEDAKDQITQSIINLGWLRRYLLDHPFCRAEFYDSY